MSATAAQFRNGGHQSSLRAAVALPDQFRTTDVRASALNA
jgi:hypothetical protein